MSRQPIVFKSQVFQHLSVLIRQLANTWCPIHNKNNLTSLAENLNWFKKLQVSSSIRGTKANTRGEVERGAICFQMMLILYVLTFVVDFYTLFDDNMRILAKNLTINNFVVIIEVEMKFCDFYLCRRFKVTLSYNIAPRDAEGAFICHLLVFWMHEAALFEQKKKQILILVCMNSPIKLDVF